MNNIVTAEEFLSLILATLKLRASDQDLQDSELDLCFERAYELLSESEDELGVAPNFTFYRHPLHGNSVKLRNALLSACEKGLLKSQPGINAIYHLNLSTERARALLGESSLSKEFLERVTARAFPALAGDKAA